jgi:predicted transcriptional regulator
MEAGIRRGKGVTAKLRRRERLHWLLSVIAACGQIEVPRLIRGSAPSAAPATLERYQRYLDELVQLDLVWIHRGRRGVRIASATARGRRALARIQAIEYPPQHPRVR